MQWFKKNFVLPAPFNTAHHYHHHQIFEEKKEEKNEKS